MNKLSLFTAAMALLTAMSVDAQSKINLRGLQMLDDLKAHNEMLGRAGSALEDPTVGALVLLNGRSVDELKAEGYDVVGCTGRVAIVNVEMSRLEAMSQLASVKSVSIGEEAQLYMDYARPAANVDEAQAGFDYEDISHAYTGAGVLTGLMDSGVDPNGINFKDEDGVLRVDAVYYYKNDNANVTAYETANRIQRFTTDDSSESHGTHVAGIMAGRCYTEGTYGYTTTANKSTAKKELIEGAIPFYGVAYGSRMAMACGSLADVAIVAGVTKIVELGEANGMPTVVNISLGSNIGPHDGTSTTEIALADLGERAIICVAAGNEGDQNISINKSFTESTTSFTSGCSVPNGIVDIWAEDSEPVTVIWGVYDKTTSTFNEIGRLEEAGKFSVNTRDENFAAGFSGSMNCTASVNANNDRYQVYTALNAENLSTNTGNRVLAFTVEGQPGQQVWVYSQNMEFVATRSGWQRGSSANSISGMATADNVVSVGAFTSRNVWNTLKNSTYQITSNTTIGAMCDFSSYGTTFQGKQLPVVAAPGCTILSSMNSYQTSSYSDDEKLTMAAVAQGESRTYYWDAMQGTSMACPFVSGVVALWLEADPSLTYEKVMEVIEETSVNDALSSTNKKQMGYGKIDAVAGLKKVLSGSAIRGITADSDLQRRAIVSRTSSSIDLYIAGEDGYTATLYDINGRMVAQRRAEGTSVSLPRVSGIAIINITTPSGQTLTLKQ